MQELTLGSLLFNISIISLSKFVGNAVAFF